jgi:hypothetical protein
MRAAGVLTRHVADAALFNRRRVTMQTLNIDGTTYKVKFDRDPIELAKLARKPYKPAKFKDLRKFPAWMPNMSTARYVALFDSMNCLQALEYFPRLNTESAAQYDPSTPLFEVFNDD